MQKTTQSSGGASWLSAMRNWMQPKPPTVVKRAAPALSQSYLHAPGQPVWSERRYEQFAAEGYIKNVIANRAVALIATGASQIGWKLFDCCEAGRKRSEISAHPLLQLLRRPNPATTQAAFVEQIVTTRMISGNCYILAIGPQNGAPKELHLLRPDRVTILSDKNGRPNAYRYQLNGQTWDYPAQEKGGARVLHLKNFHPLNDYYGLSPVEAAAYSIDMHNQANSWNQALLQNSARPSGALVVKAADNHPGHLSDDQYWRIKNQIEDQFSGLANAGRPLLLEGGLDWKEMSLSPRDMDYIDAKHSAARDIALAFGVPPQLLGIPGDNTYSNLIEARLAMWEQTILPLVTELSHAFNSWLLPTFGSKMAIEPDLETVSALAVRREQLWNRLQRADFLTQDEKRQLAGFPPLVKQEA